MVVRPPCFVKLLMSAFSRRVGESRSLASLVYVSISLPNIVGYPRFFFFKKLSIELLAESVEFRSKPRMDRCGWIPLEIRISPEVVVYIAFYL